MREVQTRSASKPARSTADFTCADDTGERYVMLAIYLWVSLCMVAAFLVWRLDRMGAKRTAAVLLWFIGFGPLLCAVTFTAYVKEAQHAEQVWDKTVKTGTVGARP